MNTPTEEVSKTSNTQPSYSLKTQEIENRKQNMHPTKINPEIGISTYNHTKLQMASHQSVTVKAIQENTSKWRT